MAAGSIAASGLAAVAAGRLRRWLNACSTIAYRGRQYSSSPARIDSRCSRPWSWANL
jgi:hypothetical protein